VQRDYYFEIYMVKLINNLFWAFMAWWLCVHGYSYVCGYSAIEVCLGVTDDDDDEEDDYYYFNQ
jgi:hypothetical protein